MSLLQRQNLLIEFLKKKQYVTSRYRRTAAQHAGQLRVGRHFDSACSLVGASESAFFPYKQNIDGQCLTTQTGMS